MKLLSTAMSLLGVLSQPILAQFTFTSTVEHNGITVPQSETDLKPFEPGTLGRIRSRTDDDSGHRIGTTTLRRVKRTNPTANSNNWCGSVQTTTSINQIKLIHGTFQHPTCTQRPGVTQYPQAAAAWIGIDGDSWTSALLQAGTVCKVLYLLLWLAWLSNYSSLRTIRTPRKRLTRVASRSTTLQE